MVPAVPAVYMFRGLPSSTLVLPVINVAWMDESHAVTSTTKSFLMFRKPNLQGPQVQKNKFIKRRTVAEQCTYCQHSRKLNSGRDLLTN